MSSAFDTLAAGRPLRAGQNNNLEITIMACLQITLKIAAENRPAAAGVHAKYKNLFLDTIPGAKSKELLIRDEDVQVLHGFGSVEQAKAYLESPLFRDDVVTALSPFLQAAPEVRIYQTA